MPAHGVRIGVRRTAGWAVAGVGVYLLVTNDTTIRTAPSAAPGPLPAVDGAARPGVSVQRATIDAGEPVQGPRGVADAERREMLRVEVVGIEDGEPIPGASVDLLPGGTAAEPVGTHGPMHEGPDDPPPVSVRCPDGRAEIPRPTSAVTLVCSAAGRETRTLHVSPDESRVRVALARGRLLHVRAERTGGSPAVGAGITVWERHPDGPPELVASTTADAEGKARVPVRDGGLPPFIVRATGRGLARAEAIVGTNSRSGWSEGGPVVLVVPEARRIRIRAVGGNAADPVAGACVRIGNRSIGVTDMTGALDAPSPQAGEDAVVTVSADGWAPAVARVQTADPEGNIEFHPVVLDRGWSFRGRVFSARGDPESGVRVRLRGPRRDASGAADSIFRGEAVTDEEGRCVLENVPESVDAMVLRISAEAPDGRFAHIRVMHRGWQEFGLVLPEVRCTDTVQIRVAGPDGTPLRDAVVRCWFVPGPAGRGVADLVATYRVDDFVLSARGRRVDPGTGIAEISLPRGDGTWLALVSARDHAAEWVALDPGHDARGPVRISVATSLRRPIVVEGRVRWVDAFEPVTATVAVTGAGADDGPGGAVAETAADGFFRLAIHPAALDGTTVTLRVFAHRNGRVVVIDRPGIAPPVTDLDLEVAPPN